jgi:hypothetical protein
MKRTPLARKTPLKAQTPLRARAPMRKRSRPKMTAARSSAKGQDCMLCFPGCPNDRHTVVLCHVRQFGGGGMGMKPRDNESCYGCSRCHDVLDGRIPWILDPPEGFDFWRTIAFAVIRTQRIMIERGVLLIQGEGA